jgi:ATP-dependent protease ClpP protease subunit
MSLRKLPAIQAFDRPAALAWDAPVKALERWSPVAAADDDGATISVHDYIGEDIFSGGGWTAKRMAGVLRSIGSRDVTVSVNSPGGDMFEGIAIYNMLAQHPHKVTVHVMGIAASAASVIAMAGDEIAMGRGAFFMIHNASIGIYGDRNAHAEIAATLAPFDAAMADIYAHRTGGDAKEIAGLMDAETWMASAQAVELGFADGVIDDAPTADGGTTARADIRARHRLDTIMAKQGMPRSERRNLFRDLSSGTHDAAAETATPSAGADYLVALRQLVQSLQR